MASLEEETIAQFQKLRKTLEKMANLEDQIDKMYPNPKIKSKSSDIKEFSPFDLNITKSNTPFNIRTPNKEKKSTNRSKSHVSISKASLTASNMKSSNATHLSQSPYLRPRRTAKTPQPRAKYSKNVISPKRKTPKKTYKNATPRNSEMNDLNRTEASLPTQFSFDNRPNLYDHVTNFSSSGDTDDLLNMNFPTIDHLYDSPKHLTKSAPMRSNSVISQTEMRSPRLAMKKSNSFDKYADQDDKPKPKPSPPIHISFDGDDDENSDIANSVPRKSYLSASMGSFSSSKDHSLNKSKGYSSDDSSEDELSDTYNSLMNLNVPERQYISGSKGKIGKDSGLSSGLDYVPKYFSSSGKPLKKKKKSSTKRRKRSASLSPKRKSTKRPKSSISQLSSKSRGSSPFGSNKKASSSLSSPKRKSSVASPYSSRKSSAVSSPYSSRRASGQSSPYSSRRASGQSSPYSSRRVSGQSSPYSSRNLSASPSPYSSRNSSPYSSQKRMSSLSSPYSASRRPSSLSASENGSPYSSLKRLSSAPSSPYSSIKRLSSAASPYSSSKKQYSGLDSPYSSSKDGPSGPGSPYRTYKIFSSPPTISSNFISTEKKQTSVEVSPTNSSEEEIMKEDSMGSSRKLSSSGKYSPYSSSKKLSPASKSSASSRSSAGSMPVSRKLLKDVKPDFYSEPFIKHAKSVDFKRGLSLSGSRSSLSNEIVEQASSILDILSEGGAIQPAPENASLALSAVISQDLFAAVEDHPNNVLASQDIFTVSKEVPEIALQKDVEMFTIGNNNTSGIKTSKSAQLIKSKFSLEDLEKQDEDKTQSPMIAKDEENTEVEEIDDQINIDEKNNEEEEEGDEIPQENNVQVEKENNEQKEEEEEIHENNEQVDEEEAVNEKVDEEKELQLESNNDDDNHPRKSTERKHRHSKKNNDEGDAEERRKSPHKHSKRKSHHNEKDSDDENNHHRRDNKHKRRHGDVIADDDAHKHHHKERNGEGHKDKANKDNENDAHRHHHRSSPERAHKHSHDKQRNNDYNHKHRDSDDVVLESKHRSSRNPERRRSSDRKHHDEKLHDVAVGDSYGGINNERNGKYDRDNKYRKYDPYFDNYNDPQYENDRYGARKPTSDRRNDKYINPDYDQKSKDAKRSPAKSKNNKNDKYDPRYYEDERHSPRRGNSNQYDPRASNHSPRSKYDRRNKDKYNYLDSDDSDMYDDYRRNDPYVNRKDKKPIKDDQRSKRRNMKDFPVDNINMDNKNRKLNHLIRHYDSDSEVYYPKPSRGYKDPMTGKNISSIYPRFSKHHISYSDDDIPNQDFLPRIRKYRYPVKYQKPKQIDNKDAKRKEKKPAKKKNADEKPMTKRELAHNLRICTNPVRSKLLDRLLTEKILEENDAEIERKEPVSETQSYNYTQEPYTKDSLYSEYNTVSTYYEDSKSAANQQTGSEKQKSNEKAQEDADIYDTQSSTFVSNADERKSKHSKDNADDEKLEDDTPDKYFGVDSIPDDKTDNKPTSSKVKDQKKSDEIKQQIENDDQVKSGKSSKQNRGKSPGKGDKQTNKEDNQKPDGAQTKLTNKSDNAQSKKDRQDPVQTKQEKPLSRKSTDNQNDKGGKKVAAKKDKSERTSTEKPKGGKSKLSDKDKSDDKRNNSVADSREENKGKLDDARKSKRDKKEVVNEDQVPKKSNRNQKEMMISSDYSYSSDEDQVPESAKRNQKKAKSSKSVKACDDNEYSEDSVNNQKPKKNSNHKYKEEKTKRKSTASKEFANEYTEQSNENSQYYSDSYYSADSQDEKLDRNRDSYYYDESYYNSKNYSRTTGYSQYTTDKLNEGTTTFLEHFERKLLKGIRGGKYTIPYNAEILDKATQTDKKKKNKQQEQKKDPRIQLEKYKRSPMMLSENLLLKRQVNAKMDAELISREQEDRFWRSKVGKQGQKDFPKNERKH